jgi:hypothetical protein
MDLTEKIYRKYPEFLYYSEGRPDGWCCNEYVDEEGGYWYAMVSCGCGEGWHDLILNALAEIHRLCKEHELDYPKIDQIKEKFGGLRLYLSYHEERINSIVKRAEEKSFTICEVTGKPGKLRQTGWWKTLCDEEAEKRGYLSVAEIFEMHGFNLGRLISSSKVLYHQENPDHIVYYNANIFTEKGKVWYGDLDITKDEEALKEVAKKVGTLYVLREMDGRFGNETLPIKMVRKKAVRTIR